MNHVTDQIQALLSGELSATESARIEAHLLDCPQCARSAEEAREFWENLGSLGENQPGSSGSVWPGVRARTLGRKDAGFSISGRGRWVQPSLAAAALAAGLMLGILIPGGGNDQIGGEAEALTVSEDQLESAWLLDTSWGEGISDFEISWIGAGLDDGTDENSEEVK